MIIRLLYWLLLHYKSNINIMVQIKVSEDLASALKWEFEHVETESKYFLDAMCEMVSIMYQPDCMDAVYTMEELFPLWKLAEQKQMLDELCKGLEVIE